jgi:hypothetical protein
MNALILLAMFGVPAAMVVLLVWLKSRERLARYRMQYDVYTLTLEKGHSVSLPDGLFAEPGKSDAAPGKGMLRAGMVSIFAGVGISLVLWSMGYFIGGSGMDAGTESISTILKMFSYTGILPMTIGIAFVIIYFFERKKGGVEKGR